MTPETIITLGTAISTALTGILFAISGIRRTGATSIREDLTSCVAQNEDLRRQYLVALSHIFVLEQSLASLGVRAPGRPTALQPAYSGVPRNGGTHRAVGE
jgi:hypothetical protein